MIAILDYGMGNIHSCIKAVSLYTKDFVYTKNKATIENSKALILPGDGHFDRAMENLSLTGLRETINKHVSSGKPLFGICIGFQILFESSEEIAQGTKKEQIEGLGYIKGKIRKFQGKDFKVPHIGWNRLQIRRKDKSILLKGISDQSFFYFIHSYRPTSAEGNAITGLCDYYQEKFPAVVEKDNIFGTQFHPEKSHIHGLKLLENFIHFV
ncbi:imidazole glycerol phosphate synthase subunit HisH [Leptospira mayottensis]|uniref:Imidazole glycerol phosphate synthase subunit HisH n=2 Tax=Leptospira mayottensis TaxID=1137606 RepID=A0AA87MNX7_9LEPT|nr:imidazole glycerol phosphate synthase subunit HisH [Leptospira mayottensis]AXR59898.1 imidazole glycerol phosphate synthase subunit HisH [Leptospira mayottensis]AXR63850.1 imidazole glycerol phosphate synthase subunit HisH [Leptospira mayottensis]AZQ00776.1 imidazole glycerol phosphate synthase subunit HisH [Leptospira mayottensis 200901116]EKR99695.1 imidazole glycerol phosphate synthase, glutamine amidotransferase subunit [Leptospira mayottensis 200901122]TGN06779.1 imidazole glycerol pho